MTSDIASPDMVGSTTGEQEIAWDSRDVMIYALGVGAGLGDPERELLFTTENSEGVVLRTIPSFLSLLTTNRMPPALAELGIDRFLHAGQEIELFHPLPPSAKAFMCSTIEAVQNKGENAIVTSLHTLRIGSAEAAITGRARRHIFVRGAGGGFTGLSTPAFRLPNSAPRKEIRYTTRPEQALLYRLSGDRHRLHSDPQYARNQGFHRPILQGLCTYGFACRALVEASGGGPDQLRAMSGRFRRPVYPGDMLTTQIWNEASGKLLFQVLDGAGNVVIDRGTAVIDV